MSATFALDRLAMRARPEGTPLMHQQWDNLLFLHWSMETELIRPLVPMQLELDTFDDKAWIGITPFALNNLRVLSLPPVPGLSSFDELNVRTYVHYNGVPGIWFFSLDASKLVAAAAARIFFMLPYFKAQISFTRDAGQFNFELARTSSPSAHFRASWMSGMRLRDPHIDSLAFFLVERYCYFAVHQTEVHMTRVYHHPWILDEANLLEHTSTMIGALGIPEPAAEPLVYFSRNQNVDIWAPAKV
jgi:uncharacterized protein